MRAKLRRLYKKGIRLPHKDLEEFDVEVRFGPPAQNAWARVVIPIANRLETDNWEDREFSLEQASLTAIQGQGIVMKGVEIVDNTWYYQEWWLTV